MLFLKRAMDKEYSFRLATELRLAASFDDLVFQYEQNGKIIHRFMQIKHTRKRYKKISIDDLLTHKKNDDFGLVKYLIAYFIIKGSGKFDNGILEDFIIATNADFDLKSLVDKKISVTKIKTKDDFLSIGNSARYKLKDLKGNIAQYLKQSMASMKDKLSKKISNGKKISDEEIDKGIKDFLNKLVFAVNLPNEVELGEIIKNELGKEFNNIDRKNVYSRFQEEALDWMKAEEGKFLSHEEINEFFEKIREEILGAIWFGIIEPVASFTGRSSELKALHDALQRSTGRQAVISQVATISGLGGVGKSELARKYAYKYGKYYGGNVIWINAENFEDMKNSFLRLAGDDRLGIPPKDKHGRDKTIEAIVEEIYAFFARRGRKSLFIFDNAEGYKGIKNPSYGLTNEVKLRNTGLFRLH
ncbi:ATP-binding protein [Wolbachia endosymbiont of Oedothorax gibbosus]|uniref:ATP-binding protein n=1 Tax=Wolbachia endosymbiont of Oedothorax gibbosus TaxID=931100 RepID=UPI00202460C3|nr:ATP-binding protein [Wolbachia endosymbiont of Oedothorax gibbosus]